MKRTKKLLLCIFASALLCGLSAINVLAAPNDLTEISENKGVNNLQTLDSVEAEKADLQAFDSLGSSTLDSSLNISRASTFANRDLWQIVDPIFVGNTTALNEMNDAYIVDIAKDGKFSFLKLKSDNPNLLAWLYMIDSSGQLVPTNFKVLANQDYGCMNIPAGRYYIMIGSYSGNERGNYQLMWNSSNPLRPSVIIDVTSDLSRVVLYYDLNTIMSNGTNILDGLTWEDHETWYGQYGYSARDMSMTVIKEKNNQPTAARAVYLGSFSSTAPYSTPRALFVDVNRGSWLYSNSYYRNVGGNVSHVIDYYDLSGQKTPRTFGVNSSDFAYGSNYIVIDLNTFKVCEFFSPFNFHYTKEGGRTAVLSNMKKVG